MPRFKNPKIRKIQQGKSHRSYYVTLPRDVVKKLGWKEHQKVTVDLDKKKRIIIKDWKRK